MYYLLTNGNIAFEGSSLDCCDIAWYLSSLIKTNVSLSNVGDLSNSFYFDYFAC